MFLDTAYAVALSCDTDRFHNAALELAVELQSAGIRLVTTRAVVLEIGNSLSRQRYRRKAAILLQSIENDETVDIIPMSEDLYREALDLFCQRPDKEWGLIDCVSYLVMTQRGISEALTTDDHFRQMGFKALLR